VVPLIYIYEGGDHLQVHTGNHAGHFERNIESQPRMCIEVCEAQDDADSGASDSPVMTRPRSYLLALIVTVVAVIATLPLRPTFDRFPYLPLLVAAVIISAWIGGLGPGLVAAAGGAVAAEYLFMGGLHAVGAYPDLLAQLAIFVAVAAIVTSIRRSRTRASAIRRNRLLWELGERVKELTLLHHVTSLLQEDKGLEALLRELVGLLPAGWQFPEMLEARITVADLVLSTPRFRVTPWIQQAEFPIHGAEPGLLEVVYLEAPSAEGGGPFLPEERSLMESLASLLASHFERTHRIKQRIELARAQASRIEAEAANRMKDTFLATVSHELRRPLTAMLGWTRMLREGNAGDTARALEVIERSANIQLRLIEELMDLSRSATGQLSVAFSLVNLNVVLRNVADAAKPAAADRQVEVTTDLAADDTLVLGDGMRLQQIVGNLVANAIKFTPAGGRVTIALERSSQEARIAVADTGIGIDPALLPQIFERFWQADPSAPPAREGLGLGLSIVRRLVELHGGTIDAHSTGPGSGTRITVTLPLAPGATREEAAAQ
jgi:signal transduction histidine kinase